MFDTLVSLFHRVVPFLALDERQLVFVIATPVFLAVAFAEHRRIRHDPQRSNVREAVKNFLLGGGYQLTELLFAGLVVFPVYELAYAHRLVTLELTPLTALATFVLVDLSFYVYHRASHRVRWLWCAHVVHHSSERMNFSTAMRQPATYVANGGWLFYAPLALLGFRPAWFGTAYALSLVYQFFVHTTLVGKLHPIVEYVLNTPSHHRAHHGRNPRYIDMNYGGVLILWDRLFGTFVEESEDDPVDFGVTRQVRTDSLVVSNLHEYVDMGRDMARPGALSKRLAHLVMPPDWTRD